MTDNEVNTKKKSKIRMLKFEIYENNGESIVLRDG
jgi:hypothetical protein